MTKIALVIIIVCAIAICAQSVYAADTFRTANLTEINGSVEVSQKDGAWQPATVGMTLNQGDTLKTKASSWAIVTLDGSAETGTVEVKQNSELKLATLIKNEEQSSQTTLLDLSMGEILIKAKKLHSEQSKFEVKTPTSIVGVRGTTFSVAVEAVE